MVLCTTTKKSCTCTAMEMSWLIKVDVNCQKKQHKYFETKLCTMMAKWQYILGMQNAVTWPLYGKLAFFELLLLSSWGRMTAWVRYKHKKLFTLVLKRKWGFNFSWEPFHNILLVYFIMLWHSIVAGGITKTQPCFMVHSFLSALKFCCHSVSVWEVVELTQWIFTYRQLYKQTTTTLRNEENWRRAAMTTVWQNCCSMYYYPTLLR